jgi:hypothetical protein
MPEGMNVEVAHKLAEHEHQRDQVHRVLEVLEVLMLAVVAVATAWSGWQAAKWDGHQSVLYGEASAHRFEADAASTRGGQILGADAAMFTAWLEAHTAGDVQLQRELERRFSSEYHAAFEAWLATEPFDAPDAVPGPGYMPEYHNPDLEKAEELNAEAAHEFEEGTHARETGEKFVRDTVLFASVLFLVAISQRAQSRAARLGGNAIAIGLLIFVMIDIIRLPTA